MTNESAANPATLMQLRSCNADGMILGVGSSVGPGGKTVRRTEWKNSIQLQSTVLAWAELLDNTP